MPAAEDYPIEALGPVLGPAAAAISRKVQAPEAIAAQSVLAAASLVAQAHADVMLPYGQTRPLSLYLATVAGSGDRKSSADNEALWPIRKYERTMKEVYDREIQAVAGGYGRLEDREEAHRGRQEARPGSAARKADQNWVRRPGHRFIPS